MLPKPCYTLLTNGSDFFLKQVGNCYAQSDLLSMLNAGNDCDLVLQLLKPLGSEQTGDYGVSLGVYRR
jgi:hypothetical protein